MIKNKIIKMILMLMLMLIMICVNNVVYAEEELKYDEYKPVVTLEKNSETENKIALILNILTVIGVVGVVVGIAMIGFNTILGSASEKAMAQEKYVGVLIAALLIVAGSAIAKVVIKIAESI